jgi:hypothetical protein
MGRALFRTVVAVALVAILAGCRTSAASVQASASPRAGVSAAWASPVSSSGVSELPVVLGRSADGTTGLWALDRGAAWLPVGPATGATAISRSGSVIAVAFSGTVDVRPLERLAMPGSARPLPSDAGLVGATVVALDISPAGRIAVVVSNGGGWATWILSGDGSATAVPAPSLSLWAPTITWLDDSSLLVLAAGSAGGASLSILDVRTGNSAPAGTLGGVRAFALSPDRTWLALATSNSLYAVPVSSALAGAVPAQVATIPDGSVAWGLAFDSTGTHLASLAGAIDEDGKPAVIRDLGYVRVGSSWRLEFDAATPFAAVAGQIWLP